MSISILRWSGLAFVTLALFPWVNFGLNNLDTQPWHIILACCFLAACVKVPVSKRALFVLIVPFVALLVGLVTTDQVNFFTLREIVNYFSFAVTFIAYYVYRRYFGMPWRVFYTANVIWWMAGIVELLVNPYVFEAVVSTRTTMDRGVTGLAAEPTFFGIFLFFISWLYLLETDYAPKSKNMFFIITNVVFIALVAKSTMVVLMIVMALVALMVRELKPRQLLKGIGGFAVAIVILWIALGFMHDSRLATIIGKLPTVGLAIAKYDASINARLANIVLSLQGFFFSWGIPQGFNSFASASIELAKLSHGFFFWGVGSPIILSFVGAAVYELGWFGLLFVLYLAATMRVRRGMRVESWFLVVILFAAVPINLPLVAFVTATGLLRWERQRAWASEVRRARLSPIAE